MVRVVLSATLPSVRLGLAAMLAEHGHQVLSADETATLEPTADPVWLLDAPDQAALDALLAHRYSDHPRAAVVLTDDPSVAAHLAHARAGLRGWACLGRDAGSAELDLAVRAADAGLVTLDLPIAAATVGSPTRPANGSTSDLLTPRELQVLQLVAEGLPNKGIARALGISENTAKFHVAALIAKLGAASRTEAVALAARRGLLLL